VTNLVQFFVLDPVSGVLMQVVKSIFVVVSFESGPFLHDLPGNVGNLRHRGQVL
jgi:hypothetical protein